MPRRKSKSKKERRQGDERHQAGLDLAPGHSANQGGAMPRFLKSTSTVRQGQV